MLQARSVKTEKKTLVTFEYPLSSCWSSPLNFPFKTMIVLMYLSKNLINLFLNEQVWLWPNKAPGIVGSGSYDITIQCGSKDMSLEKYILILQKI